MTIPMNRFSRAHAQRALRPVTRIAAALVLLLLAGTADAQIQPSVSSVATVLPTKGEHTITLHPEVWCADGGVLELLFFCELTVTIPPATDSCDACAILAAAINNDPGCQSQGFSASCDGAFLTVSNSSTLGCENAFVCFDPIGVSQLKAAMDYKMNGPKMPIHAYFVGVASGESLVPGETPGVTVLHKPTQDGPSTFAAHIDVTPGMTAWQIVTALDQQMKAQGDDLTVAYPGGYGGSLQVLPRVRYDTLMGTRAQPGQGMLSGGIASGPSPGVTTPTTAPPPTLSGATGFEPLGFDLLVRNTADGISWALSPDPDPLVTWGHAVPFDAPELLTLSLPGISMDVGDVTGDGWDDVVVLEAQAATALAPSATASIRGPGAASPTSAGSQARIEIFPNLGNGSFGTASVIQLSAHIGAATATTVVRLGDMDVDGDLDIYLGDFTNGLHRFANDGSGNFSLAGTHPETIGTTGLTLGSLNGDAIPDVVLVSAPFGLAVVGVGTAGGFTFSAFATPPQPTEAAIFDLELGGDLAIAHQDVGTGLSVWRNQGNSFQLADTFGGLPVRSVDAADLDGDGSDDLAIAWNSSTELGVLLNTGGSLTLQVTGPEAPFASRVRLEDMNGDDDVDVLAALSVGRLAVPTGNGDGTFYSFSNVDTGLLPGDLATGDVDQDGRTDVAVLDLSDHTVRVYRNLAP